jgi:hypothetical protein
MNTIIHLLYRPCTLLQRITCRLRLKYCTPLFSSTNNLAHLSCGPAIHGGLCLQTMTIVCISRSWFVFFGLSKCPAKTVSMISFGYKKALLFVCLLKYDQVRADQSVVLSFFRQCEKGGLYAVAIPILFIYMCSSYEIIYEIILLFSFVE